MERRQINSAAELVALVNEFGFIPFLESPVEGFTLKPYVPEERWFSDGMEGPWEWKGQGIGRYAYGKLFCRLAGFVSLAYWPFFIAYRRDGYDFEGYYEDGCASYKAKRIVDALTHNGPMLSTELKRACGFCKEGESGFDLEIARLQMTTFVTTEGFAYAIDRHGRPYGWGIARYALTEQAFGEDFVRSAQRISPVQAKETLLLRARELCPDARDKALEKLIKA